jgi:hypothetical protein
MQQALPWHRRPSLPCGHDPVGAGVAPSIFPPSILFYSSPYRGPIPGLAHTNTQHSRPGPWPVFFVPPTCTQKAACSPLQKATHDKAHARPRNDSACIRTCALTQQAGRASLFRGHLLPVACSRGAHRLQASAPASTRTGVPWGVAGPQIPGGPRLVEHPAAASLPMATFALDPPDQSRK